MTTKPSDAVFDHGTVPPRRGLIHALTRDGIELITDRLPERGKPGGRLIGAAAFFLTLLAVGFFAVSLKAQQVYVFNVKGNTWVSWVEGLGPDGLMVVFSLLGLGLAMQGKPARTVRVLILVWAALSALMNYAAADSTSWRSVLAYTLPVVALAISVDQLISVVRRWALDDDEESPWRPVGRAALKAMWITAALPLYPVRLALDWDESKRGLRQVVLKATPLPKLPPGDTRLAIDPPKDASPAPLEQRGSKAARLRGLYEEHDHFGDRSKVPQVAAELAPLAGLQPNSARTTLYNYLDRLGAGDGQ